MSIVHTTITTKSGVKLRIEKELSFGGQGRVYLAQDSNTNESVVVKIFNNKSDRTTLINRIAYLIEIQKKHSFDGIVFPYDLIETKDLVGHCTTYIDSVSLEDYLMNSTGSLAERLEIALTIAKQFKHLHGLGIAHGDIRAQNFLLQGDNAFCIDLDNFNHVLALPPNMVGEALYLSPEQRDGHNNGKYYLPTIETDLYQLGILFHEILLLLHPAHGYDETQEEFEQAMNGEWKLDPFVSKKEKNKSISILNNQLCNLFRLALKENPEKRTTADIWIQVLKNAIERVYNCPTCNTSMLIDSSKTSCPLNHQFEQLNLVDSKTNKIISTIEKSFFVGRAQFNNDMKVSYRQLLVRRIGPELWVEHLGTNPTQYNQNRVWFDLPKNKKVKLHKNEFLKIMGYELQVI